MKICLVVDDSDVIRRIARRIVEGLGYIVVEAETTAQAHDLCLKGLPHLILVDWRLPGGDTHQLISKIAAIKADHVPAIIYCATEADPIDINAAFSAGATGYLLKPFDRETLYEKIYECTAPGLAIA
ncbi:MAG: response regulator [Hyphomicrobiaceae bacterium]|nr:response regulator [Hyphomicrobiaceae bacterium]